MGSNATGALLHGRLQSGLAWLGGVVVLSLRSAHSRRFFYAARRDPFNSKLSLLCTTLPEPLGHPESVWGRDGGGSSVTVIDLTQGVTGISSRSVTPGLSSCALVYMV